MQATPHRGIGSKLVISYFCFVIVVMRCSFDSWSMRCLNMINFIALNLTFFTSKKPFHTRVSRIRFLLIRTNQTPLSLRSTSFFALQLQQKALIFVLFYSRCMHFPLLLLSYTKYMKFNPTFSFLLLVVVVIGSSVVASG